MHDVSVKLYIHPLNGKKPRRGDDICRKFAIVCIVAEGDDLPKTIEMRLEPPRSVGFGRLECND